MGMINRAAAAVKAIKTILIAMAVTLLCPVMSAEASADAFSVHYGMYFSNLGWSIDASDNMVVYRSETYPTGLRMYLTGQPDMSGTVQYQVYQGGWLKMSENYEISGTTDSTAPIESIRAGFNGELEKSFDIYYRVYQNGAWSGWASDFGDAGMIGSGSGISGIQATVVRKGDAPLDTRNIDPSRPMVALTFDDGPSSENTPRILAALETVGGRATFFVVGTRVLSNKDVLRRMVADGDEIGNHTWNHNYLHKATAEQIVTYVGKTADAVQEACGVRPVAVRPPGGGINQKAQETLAALGSPAILWNIDTLDWKHRNTQKTISAVLDHVSDGDIVLMHDIHKPTAAAAEVIIPELAARGYQLVTVTELASMRGGYIPGQKYYSFKSR